MFNKIRKRGHRKSSKSDGAEPPIPTSNASPNPDVTVNHASIPAAAQSQPLSLAGLRHNSGGVEVLPLLKEVPLTDRHSLFIKKLQICCNSFDFLDTMKNAREKEIKRQTLSELVDMVQSGSCKMNEIMQEGLVKMISINVFRCLPPSASENKGADGVDPDEDDMYLEPAWPHLQIVYELLLRYIVSPDMDTKVAKRYLDHSFVLKVLDLFDTEDPREREYLKTILHRIYGKFMVHRPFIRKAINDVFYRFIFETERHSGICELLEILGSIINGFALPMKEEHKLFLIRALIPLHKTKCVASYHQQLSYCITQFVEKDFRLADIVIRGLLKYWPVTNCGKEVLFLGELEEILEATQPEEFQRCMVPLFRQIGRSINSSHFQVAERALFWWNNEHIVSLIAENRHTILPIIFEALENNITSHWNQAINGLSSNVRRMFLEMDAELFEECQKQYEEKVARAGTLKEEQLMIWKRLEEAALEAAAKFNKQMLHFPAGR